MMIPARSIATILCCVLCAGLLSCSNSQPNHSKANVIQLDGFGLTANDFAKRLALKIKSYDALTVKDQIILSRAKDEVVDDYLLETLAIRWSQAQGLQLKDSTVKEEISKVKSAYPDELTFKRVLANEGLTYDYWLKSLRQGLLQRIVFNAVTEKIEPPNKNEIKNYFEEHKVEFRTKDQIKIRQIVLQTENNAKRVLRELNSGKTFQDLAKKFSITPEAKDGGQLGWVEKGSYEIFDEALKGGGHGIQKKIFNSNFGFHIIEIQDVKKGSQLGLQDVEQKVIDRLLQEKRQVVFNNWLEAELRSARVFKNEELINAIFVETKK
jgi:peptidyl-prolyl cis-trans isomerase C